jgi:S-adenosylmethionine:tRNA ribosyltransferase-isomerase
MKRFSRRIVDMFPTDLRTADFDFDLPEGLIAQEPTPRREESRLLVLHRDTGSIEHRRFSDITAYLQPGDLLVANRSRVIPARIMARKKTGASVELLLLRSETPVRWTAMARPTRKLREDMELEIPGSTLSVRLISALGEGEWTVEFSGEGNIEAQIRAAGQVPLPPYIRNENAPLDRYQTVYADRDGSVAAPTAGLHFTEDLLREIREGGVGTEFVTLHVGPGTFKPVSADRIADHRMHGEWGEVLPETASAVNHARSAGSRVVTVGTTSTRLLETAWENGAVHPYSGETALFIYPGFQFHVVGGLVTNFHLPRSTLLMLVSALAGRELVLHAYREAVRLRYRFYSFGDAMLIL